MLRRLFIRDFVIVDRLELDFEAGFGALTGETGAGKSILVDALSLVLGERAEAAVVRTGAERAEVSAEFDVEQGGALETWLRANDFEADDSVLLRRVVDAGGRSRAYLNGLPATAGQLREAAGFLADIHGQHAHLSLMKVDAQRRLLDTRAGQLELAREVAGHFQEWRQLRDAREHAARDAETAQREREMLEFQVRELEGLAFDGARWNDENAEHRRLSHAVALIEGVEAALAALDDSEAAAGSLVDQAAAKLGHLVDHDPALAEPVELLEGARIQLSEAVHALARYRERLDLDPARLAELDARIDAVMAAARKHRVAPEELPETLATMRQRLDELRLSADPEALAKREAEALAAWRKLAAKLSAARSKAAAELARAVTASMQELAMAGGRFDIALTALSEPSAIGLESVEFTVSANPGQPLRPLAKVASGGELSRIGLAIQVIASQAAEAPTLIFDEVDVGIGGGVAEIVGRLLKQLGRERQVLCVTHLPQVAAQADWQWSIAKESRDGATLSRVTPLDQPGRVDEIARMLGGVRITDTTREHAREMLGL
ncbi:MAG: DNA repair protein RecN [Sterolibacteriaceae bacterium MAG5]|nr:DNA repair protein RecN [Candidatus Nitricoxidireducens bremensis]